MSWNQSAYTVVGAEMLTETLSGRKLTITQAFGGTEAADEGSLGNATDVQGDKIALGLMGIEDAEAEDSEGNLVPAKKVGIMITNEGRSDTCYLHQVAVFGRLDGESEDRMIYILQDERGIEIPPEADNPDFEVDLYAVIFISNKAQITVNVTAGTRVTPSQVQKMIEDHNKSPDAHAETIKKVVDQAVKEATGGGSGSIDDAIAAHDKDPNAHSTIIAAAVSKEVAEMAEGGSIVTKDTMEQAVKDQVDKALAALPAGSYYGYLDITIPASGWIEAEAPSADHNYTCDVAVEGVTADLIPFGDPKLGSFGVANKAEVVPGCDTMEGAVRFYSKEIPEADISAFIILLKQGKGETDYELPVATETTLGGVKIGEGLAITPDGTATVEGAPIAESEKATVADANAVMDEVYKDGEGS